ncbi:MAG: beta-propeller fold lactonase family protein [Acidobacteria bacterium]|nr:beta-propeller fold lactonase family protein [Acidobacteriota bacterium]
MKSRGSWYLVLLLLLVGASAVNGQPFAGPDKLPGPTDKLLIVVSPREDAARVFLATDDRLDLFRVVKTGKGPTEVCLSPDGKKAYVTNTGGEGITVIDLATLTVSATLSDASLQRPVGIALTPDGQKIYVGARGSGALVVLSIDGKMLKQLPVKDATMVAVSPDGKRAYVCSDSTESVIVVDTATDTVVGTIKTARQPRGLGFTPDGKMLLITCVAHDLMHYVNVATSQVETTVGVGRSPQSVAITPDGRLAFSVTRTVQPGGAVSTASIMDLRKNYRRKVGDIPVDSLATKVVISGDGGYLYVSCSGADPAASIVVIDLLTHEMVRTTAGGAGPAGMAFRK